MRSLPRKSEALRIRFSPRARRDLRKLILYIANDSPSNARLVRDRISEAIQRLSLHPESGRPGRLDGTRELVIPHTAHIAVYRVSGGSLEIVALIHESRQRPTDL
jgi:toxin ParE1/3/4